MRNSNIELLRIVSICMIIIMHVLSFYKDFNDSYINHLTLFMNAFCNSGVTIFILISGYYGIRFNCKNGLLYLI